MVQRLSSTAAPSQNYSVGEEHLPPQVSAKASLLSERQVCMLKSRTLISLILCSQLRHMSTSCSFVQISWTVADRSLNSSCVSSDWQASSTVRIMGTNRKLGGIPMKRYLKSEEVPQKMPSHMALNLHESLLLYIRTYAHPHICGCMGAHKWGSLVHKVD